MSAQGLGSRAIIGEFYARLSADPGMAWINAASMLFNSDQASETYKWLGMAPAMRQWVGGRNAKGFRENGITISNLTFEATLEVLVDEMRRDKTGQVMVRVGELAARTNTHWASLLSTLINAGETGVCYDGQYFFDTDHTEGDNTTSQSNDLSVDISAIPGDAALHGSTTAPSVLEMSDCILQAIAAIKNFKDDQNEPMNENANAFLIMTPTMQIWKAAAGAINNTMLGNGQSNTLVQMPGMSISLQHNPRLTWTEKFAVFRTDGQVKPFIRQQEEDVSLAAVAEGSELEFNENKHRYGVKAIRNVGYGYWQHACMVTMT